MSNDRGRRPRNALTGGIITGAVVAVAAGTAGGSASAAAPVQAGDLGMKVVAAAVPPEGMAVPVQSPLAQAATEARANRSARLRFEPLRPRPATAKSRARTRARAVSRVPRATPAPAAHVASPARHAVAARPKQAAAHPPPHAARPAASPTATHAAATVTPGFTYRPGTMGFDLSFYQCGQALPPRAPIGVVQVSAGSIDQGPNPCLRQEMAWAGAGLSDYIFMDGYPGGTSPIAMKGPRDFCAVHNAVCRAYDYGYNWAVHWVSYAHSQGRAPHEWWLDIEQTGTWGSIPLNQATIKGAVSALWSQHDSVGMYSTPYQWQAITGPLKFPGVALWVPGAGNLTGGGYSATGMCRAAPRQSFADGRVEMVQWGYRGGFPGAYSGGSPFDLDYAC